MSRCIYRPGVEDAASSFVIRSAAAGSRTIVNYNGLEEMSVGEFRGVVEGACAEGEESWWHFEVGFAPSPSPIPIAFIFFRGTTDLAFTMATRTERASLSQATTAS